MAVSVLDRELISTTRRKHQWWMGLISVVRVYWIPHMLNLAKIFLSWSTIWGLYSYPRIIIHASSTRGDASRVPRNGFTYATTLALRTNLSPKAPYHLNWTLIEAWLYCMICYVTNTLFESPPLSLNVLYWF